MTSLQIAAPSVVEATAITLESAALADVVAADALTTAGLSDLRSTANFSKAGSQLNIRRSLRASTLDGAFSSAFENIVRGVLISNFLIGLGADAFEVGLLSSIPMLAHLLQPLGAYLSEKTASRHLYCFWIYGVSRLLWLVPAGGIFAYSHGAINAHELTLITMAVLTLSNIFDAIGCASWMSWMAVLVPAQVRGRYFSLRRSLASIVALVTIPICGWLVSSWLGGEVEGYGIALIIAVLMGLISLGFQFQMSDVNPQATVNQQTVNPQTAGRSRAQSRPKAGDACSSERSLNLTASSVTAIDAQAVEKRSGLLGDFNFLTLLLFLVLWTFGINLCAPFFSFYMLDELQLGVQWVTLYSGMIYGAFFLMILLWGKLADRIGNRPVLLLNCLLMAAIPLLWLYTGNGLMSVWLGLPLIHMLEGGTVAALDLCLANIQLELAPPTRQSHYFAIAAALMGVSGAMGTTVGSLLAEMPKFGIPMLFALSALVRLLSIVPLVFVREERALTLRQLVGEWPLVTQLVTRLSRHWQLVRVKA
jgi:MFS family permease